MVNRRDALTHSAIVAGLLASLGVVPVWAQSDPYHEGAFTVKNMAEAVKAYGGAAPVASTEISVQAPDIAENGAVVPFGASTTLSGVKRIFLMVEKNPNVLSAMFELTDQVQPNIATRVKVGQSSNLYAVAMMNDGRVLFAQKEVKVTLGGCGG